MRIVFAGTPTFSLAPLRALHDAGIEIAAVLTQPDRPTGRKGVLTPSPVKLLAEELGIPVLQPEKLRSDLSQLNAVHADIMVTCAYGQILSQETLDLFSGGVWNVHASLLPAYRGAAPIARAIIDGARETGITIMKTDVGLDTGDIFLQKEMNITESDTCGSLTERLSGLGAELIVDAVKKIGRGEAVLRPQVGGFVCKKVSRTEIDFSQNAHTVSALVRGLSPAPLSFGIINGLTLNFYFAEVVEGMKDAPYGTVLSVNPKQGFIVSCGKGAVRLSEIQPSGGKRMTDRDFLNGRKVSEGMRFECVL